MNYLNDLTSKGRKNLTILILLSVASLTVVSLSIVNLVVNNSSDDVGRIDAYLVMLAIPFAYYASLLKKLHDKLKGQALSQLEFQTITNPTLLEYRISSRGQTEVVESYTGKVLSQPYKLINFNVNVGYGRKKTIKYFIGAEFETQKLHLPVHIYDKKNDLAPMFNKIKLESNEFNKNFNVYSNDPKHPFYQLDTDTMADLIDVKKHLGYGINIESFANKIFIYIDGWVLQKKLYSTINFISILNEDVTQKQWEEYKSIFTENLESLHKIFTVLDFKLANITVEAKENINKPK